MLTAVWFGLAASSALVIGSLVGAKWSPPKRVTGVLLAFASGALISALAFELFEEAFKMGGPVRSGLGLLAGAATFVAVDTALDKYISGKSGPESREVAASGTRGGVGLALLAAVNLPESLVGAVAMRNSGTSARAVVVTWLLCALLLAAAVVFGRSVAAGMSEHVLAVALSFAGGAVVASLADTLMPEAFEHGRPLNAFATAGGFFLSFVLAG